MSITLSPAKARYLDQVQEQLSDLPPEEREEIVQDLEAHLSELADSEIEAELGNPLAFASEFRSSAGLNDPARRPVWDALPRIWGRVEGSGRQLAQITHWPKVRPAWVWVRGWLVISAWALLYYNEPFIRFPIPSIGFSSLTGLVVVIAATTLSFWLDSGSGGGWRRVASTGFSFIAGWAIVGTLFNPVYREEPLDPSIEGLQSEVGPVTNIYAYDLAGRPVTVLLYDQDGNALLTVPTYVYEENFVGAQESFSSLDGVVTFERDRYGRIIPNLYPLDIMTYDEFGQPAEPMPPPTIGFPSVEEDAEEPGGARTVPPS